jgi:hypothetical protein
MGTELLAQSHELTTATFIPEETRASVVLQLWDIALPLERYAGCSDRRLEHKVLLAVRQIRLACDEILLPDPDSPVERAERLEAAIAGMDNETYEMIRSL